MRRIWNECRWLKGEGKGENPRKKTHLKIVLSADDLDRPEALGRVDCGDRRAVAPARDPAISVARRAEWPRTNACASEPRGRHGTVVDGIRCPAGEPVCQPFG